MIDREPSEEQRQRIDQLTHSISGLCHMVIAQRLGRWSAYAADLRKVLGIDASVPARAASDVTPAPRGDAFAAQGSAEPVVVARGRNPDLAPAATCEAITDEKEIAP